MSSPLVDVWEAAAASPFQPSIGKDSQFTLGFALLFACMLLLWSYAVLYVTVLTPLQRCS